MPTVPTRTNDLGRLRGGVTGRRDCHLYNKGTVVNLVEIISELYANLEELKYDLLRSETNKSANRRARKKTVSIRSELKDLRKKLLELEKEM
jgi:hypothetical protein